MTTLSELLLDQWQAATKLRGIVTDGLQPILDDSLDTKSEIESQLDIDNAEGVWLDIIGRVLGLDRPSTSDPTMDTRFGFDAAGAGFDRLPFRGVAANDAVYALGDGPYRRILKARAIMVLGDGTVQALRDAVREIDPNATVTDNRDMTVTITTTQRETVELADEIGALPRPAGVAIVYA